MARKPLLTLSVGSKSSEEVAAILDAKADEIDTATAIRTPYDRGRRDAFRKAAKIVRENALSEK